MKTLTYTLLVVLTVALAGCSRNTIVGSWDGSDPAMPAGATASFTFGGDDSYSTTMEVMGTSITIHGTYQLNDKTLTMTPVSVDASGGAFAEIAKDQFQQGSKEPVDRTVEFKSKDEITLTASMGTTTLTRKK